MAIYYFTKIAVFISGAITALLLIRRKKQHSDADRRFMLNACEQASLCIPVNNAFCVGCVIVRNGKVISTGYSREIPGNTHAEQCALEKMNTPVTPNDVMYTTMEPCSTRLSNNKACVYRCIEAGIKRVVIGALEPKTFVNCEGVRILKENGISVTLLTELEDISLAPNQHLLE